MSTPESFNSATNNSQQTTEAIQVLDCFWDREHELIRDLTPADFKNQELPLARIKKIMKLDEDVKMISAEAPVLFAKAAELFITELSLRAWVHTEDNKRRTLQRNDIAMAITKYDQFDFLIDIVPREELKPPKRMDEGIRGTAVHPDQVHYYLQLAQQHQQALQQQQTAAAQPAQQIQQTQPQQIQLVPTVTANSTQGMPVQATTPTFSMPNVIQVQAVQTDAQQQAQAQLQVQVQNAQASAPQVLQLQQPITGQVNQAGGIQIVQQIVNNNGELQQIPLQLNPNQLQLIRMQLQGSQNHPIIIHASPVQQNAAQTQGTAVFQQATQQLTQQQAQTVYQIQQVAAQSSGQTSTPVFLTQAAGTAVQIQAITADQSSTDEEQQQ